MIATLLDSRFKILAFSNNKCASHAREILIEEANKYMSNDSVSTSADIAHV